jgi:glycerol uptake facilitator protein
MEVYLAEVVGTMLLVIFGDGVVANVCLARTKGHGSGWIVIATGWGLGVALAIYAVGRISGAHINPAVTLGLASIGAFDLALVPGYIAAQVLGGFLGAVVVWLSYLPHFDATDDAATVRGVFCTAPEIRSTGANFTAEVIGTVVLVFGVLAIGANAGELQGGEIDLSAAFSTGLSPFLVGVLVWGIGLSLGGPTGYAINPARDLGPRLAPAVLPLRNKGDSDWGYSWIPVVGPVVGGVAGAWLFRLLGF